MTDLDHDEAPMEGDEPWPTEQEADEAALEAEDRYIHHHMAGICRHKIADIDALTVEELATDQPEQP